MADRTEIAHNCIMRHAQGRLTGDELRLACPNHSNDDGLDSHPSFSYNVRKKVGRCFSCPFSGDAIRIAEAMGWRGWLEEVEDSAPSSGRIEGTYDHRNEAGHLLYQVVRYVPKAFRQRRPDGQGEWIWDLGGVRRMLLS